MALLGVSQIIPTLSSKEAPDLHSSQQQQLEGGELLKKLDLSGSGAAEKAPLPRHCNDERQQSFETLTTAPAEEESKTKGVTAAFALLCPLLVSCIDDDWNADVRALAVGVVRQLFLDLQVSMTRLAALPTMAAAADTSTVAEATDTTLLLLGRNT